MAANLSDARGLTFECKPGCGFCCTASPLVTPPEAPALGRLVVKAADGSLRIPLAGPACSALRADRACGVYEARPSVCHLYPYQVHAGRRLQATVSLACPGVAQAHAADEPDTDGDARHPFGVANAAEDGAARAVALALAQPGAAEMAQRAKETFAEFDRRMKEWGVQATPDRLRAAFLPHVDALARPAMLPALFTGLAPGELTLEGSPARAVGDLLETEPEGDLVELLEQGARDAFDEPETVIWVEPDLSWTTVEGDGATVRLTRWRDGGRKATELRADEVPVDWDEPALDALAAYLKRLLHRDLTEGAAAWLVDASGYQATPASAYGRVLAEASLQVALRAGLLALEARADAIDAPLARRGIAAYETAYHSLPTLGSIL